MTNPKYNPNKNGKANTTHHIVKNYDDTGTYYRYGLGCDFYQSCFNCGFNDCKWNGKINGKGG